MCVFVVGFQFPGFGWAFLLHVQGSLKNVVTKKKVHDHNPCSLTLFMPVGALFALAKWAENCIFPQAVLSGK